MKILFVINDLGSGGAEKILFGLSKSLSNLDNVSVDILLTRPKKLTYLNNFLKHKINVYYNKKKHNGFRNIIYFSRFMQKNKYDIVHSHLFPSQYYIAIYRFFNPKNRMFLVTTEHSTTNRRRKFKFLKILDKIVYSQYHRIISVSNQTQTELINWISPNIKNKSKYFIINNGFFELEDNDSMYSSNSLDILFKSNVIKILVVARFAEPKDHFTVIRAMNLLSNKYHLFLAGEGPLEKKIKNLVKGLKLDNRVHFLGFQKKIKRIISNADIIVISSRDEGFGLIMIEAMSLGKPVIASSISGLRETGRDAAIFFELGNEKELKTKIIELTTNKTLYSQYAESGLSRAKNFSLEKMVDAYYNLYLKLLDKEG